MDRSYERKIESLSVLFMIVVFLCVIILSTYNMYTTKQFSGPETPVYIHKDTTDDTQIKVLNKLNNMNMVTRCTFFSDFLICSDDNSVINSSMRKKIIMNANNSTFTNSTYNISNQDVIYNCYDIRNGSFIYNKTENKKCIKDDTANILTDREICNVIFRTSFDDMKIINNTYYQVKCVYNKVEYTTYEELKSVTIDSGQIRVKITSYERSD